MDVFKISEPVSLFIGGAAIMLAFGSSYLIRGEIEVFAIVGIAAFLASIPHELAHKYSAVRLGCYARYILSPVGLLITLVSAIPYLPIRFLMPGYVVVSSPYYDPVINKRVNGIVSYAGPLVNIVLGVASILAYHFLIPWLILVYGLSYWIIVLAWFLVVNTQINGWVAIFNLLPIPPLDGSKIIAWKPLIWIIMIVAAGIILYIGAFHMF